MKSDISLDKLIAAFFKKGGKIDEYYLRYPNLSKRTLVHLHGWFSGQNVRAAIMKALGK